MRTPVAFLIFNRPDTTARVFREIARAKPLKLFVIADGPRSNYPTDVEKCADSRAVIERIDWPCEVMKNYSDVNLGCGLRPANGISWVFDQVEETIILEDDCVPHPTFFRFCEELLERYHDDERVMMISGRNNLPDQKRRPYSYSFRCIMSCWGWATWRRAWEHFDMEMRLWPAFRTTSWLVDILGNTGVVKYWHEIFDKAHADARLADYWDYQWAFACWAQNALTAVPNTNLIRNVGFGETATHTRSLLDERANISTAAMSFPLQHPPYLVRDKEAEQLIHENILGTQNYPKNFRRRLFLKLSDTAKRMIRSSRCESRT